MNLLAIVILNYNGRSYLEKFLPSVLAYSDNHPIYIADNASVDDSVSWLRTHYPQVHLVQLPTNLGFAEGYNVALKHIRAKYYCLLNSDVEVCPDWTKPLLEVLEKEPSVAAVQPKILSYYRKNHFEYGGGVGGYIDPMGYAFTRGRIFDFCEDDINQYDDAVECFWACGACMIIRSELYHCLGGLDSDFFAHMEEIDLCWRIQMAGYSIYAIGSSTVYHVGGGTLNYHNARKAFLNFRNSLAMLYKNIPGNQLVWKIFLRLVLDGVAGIKFLLQGSPEGCWAVARAHFNFYRNFPLWYKKRRALKSIRTSKMPNTVYPRSILKEYFFLGKRTYSSLNEHVGE
ncbi:MAG: glycosyltransferase family 2 protein [Siphonobacter sp.]